MDTPHERQHDFHYFRSDRLVPKGEYGHLLWSCLAFADAN